jgi:hypothetical protein
MAEFSLALPGQEGERFCTSEAEVVEALETFRRENPDTLWVGVLIHELRPGGTAAPERSVFEFIEP